MAVMKTHISWTDSTWNPTTGCTKVSPGCDHCYAERITNRLMGGNFDVVKMHEQRLKQVHGFQPLKGPEGLRPRMVFVNSMSDIMHRDIPEAFKDKVFDAMETNPTAIFQVLTKRHQELRKYIEARYKDSGVPPHIWLGVSVEDNSVKNRIVRLVELKDVVGDFTAFLSVEPLIGPVDQHDYTGIDWVLIGGESGPQCRPMDMVWFNQALEEARRAGAKIWGKQYGHPRNNPVAVDRAKKLGISISKAFQEICQLGLEREPDEKGGATFDGKVWHELPPAYAKLRRHLNKSLI